MKKYLIYCLLFMPVPFLAQVNIYKKSDNRKVKTIRNDRVVLYLLKSDSAGALDGASGTKKCRGTTYRRGILTGITDSAVSIDNNSIPFSDLAAIAHLKTGQKNTGKLLGCIGVTLLAFSYLEHQNYNQNVGEEERYAYYIPLLYAGAPLTLAGAVFLIVSRTAVYDLRSEYYLGK